MSEPTQPSTIKIGLVCIGSYLGYLFFKKKKQRTETKYWFIKIVFETKKGNKFNTFKLTTIVLWIQKKSGENLYNYLEKKEEEE